MGLLGVAASLLFVVFLLLGCNERRFVEAQGTDDQESSLPRCSSSHPSLTRPTSSLDPRR